MTNCLSRIVLWRDRQPDKLAVWEQADGITSFKELLELAAGFQQSLAQRGFAAGDTLLMAVPPGKIAYACYCAALGLGGRLMFMEPWLDPAAIDYAMQLASPKFVLATPVLRRLMERLPSIRSIPHKLSPKDLSSASEADFQLCDVDDDSGATITFSSGSQGRPKAIIRSHKYTLNLVDILTEGGCRDPFPEPDLTIFPAVGALHLLSGRGTMVVQQSTSARQLQSAAKAAASLQPKTLTTSPAFLERLLEVQGYESLEHIYIGGASADVALIEKARRRWPAAQITHVYGCSEAEPIALVDATVALDKARERGDMQIRYVGHPLPFLTTELSPDGLWVSGPNVCSEAYLDTSRGIRPTPSRNTGYPWHLTGDRFEQRDDGWYFAGRSHIPAEDFALEQLAFQVLGHTRAFITRSGKGARLLVTESSTEKASEILKKLPGVQAMIKLPIARDRRHLSRIDRAATLRPRSAWRRWQLFFKERAALPGIALVASGPAFGGFAPDGSADNWILAVLSFLFVVAALILARLMDECKDYDKDCLVNPGRPLPRGLVTASETRAAVNIVTVAMMAIAFALAYMQSTWAAIMGLTSTLYLLLMEREFFVGERLAKSPLIYALSHQLLIVPLYLLPILAVPRHSDLGTATVIGFLVANFAGSMAYEVARKLSPAAAPGANTYLQSYGPKTTSYLLVACGLVTTMGALSMHSITWAWPIIALFFATIYLWRRFPERYQLVEISSLTVGLSQLWALAILR